MVKQIFIWLGVILTMALSLAFVFGILILLGYVSNYATGDYSNNMLKCSFDENFNVLFCFTDGIVYFLMWMACVIGIMVLLSPVFLFSKSEEEINKYCLKMQIISVPLYFFGVELMGAITTNIVGGVHIKPFNQCNFQSYYDFFNINCKINGMICIIVVSIIFWMIFGMYKLIQKIRSCHHTLRKIQNNYGSIEEGTL